MEEENTNIVSLCSIHFEVNSGDIIRQKSNNSLFYIGEKTVNCSFWNFDITIVCNLSIAKKYLLTSLQLLNKDFLITKTI
jgi:hypothetical protein